MALEDREQRMAAVSEKLELDLELLGATAVEDKLQVKRVVEVVQGGWGRRDGWIVGSEKVELALSCLEPPLWRTSFR